jgi:dTMP kinase
MFIAFEGVDGSGKTTLIEFFHKAIQDHLAVCGKKTSVLRTREPGGSELAEQIRALIMHYDMHIQAEILMMYAARVDHFEKTIHPQLKEGGIVLTDRYFYSSFAYQGGGQKGSMDLLNDLMRHFHQQFSDTCLPDYLIFLDVDVDTALARRKARRAAQNHGVQTTDKFEAFDLDFQRRVYASYQQQIKNMPLLQPPCNQNILQNDEPSKKQTQLIKIDATQSIQDAQNDLLNIIPQLFS